MEYGTDTRKETLDIREHMRFCCDLLDSESKLQAWNEQYFDDNGGVPAGWLLKTVGECIKGLALLANFKRTSLLISCSLQQAHSNPPRTEKNES